MTLADAVVVVAAVALTALLGWFFFGAKRTSRAELRGGVQEITVVVKGGYAPDRIEVRQGVPVRMVFDRQETGECTSRVVFADFGINRALPAFASTAVELTPTEVGEYGFACGMNMLHGTLVVSPDGRPPPRGGPPRPAAPRRAASRRSCRWPARTPKRPPAAPRSPISPAGWSWARCCRSRWWWP